MRLTEAHERLAAIGVPSFTTNEAAAVLGVGRNHASQLLRRLATTGHALHLARGRWTLPGRIDRFALPEALVAPSPAYVSLYSALYEHGLIEQIPTVLYAVTLAPPRRVKTPLGTVSLHQVSPSFFFGFEVPTGSTGKLALAEKALVDVLYLKTARSKLFRALPELDLPRGFNRRRAQSFAERIADPKRRTMVLQGLGAAFEIAA